MNNLIKAVIIDDEENFIASLEILLKKHFKQILIIGKAGTIEDGLSLINQNMPDLVFLDIHLPDGNGFDLINYSKYKNFDVIFTTSFSEYAVRAFEVSAIHYILKPIELKKLEEAIDRFEKKIDNENLDEKLRLLKESLLEKPQKILLPTSEGNCIYNIGEIIRCEAESSYSTVYFLNGEKVMISKPLQSLHKILSELDFVRIHAKFLINLKFVKRYVIANSPKVVMVDNAEFPISHNQKKLFVDKMRNYVKAP
jgi:two-component system LytT family response regulator